MSTIATDGPPQLPMLLYGKVNSTNSVPSGTVVMAKVNGEVVNQAEVTDGWYGVPGNNRLIIPECDSFDLIVNVNGEEYLVVDDYDWKSSFSGSERIDLDYSLLEPLAPTPTPTPSPTPPSNQTGATPPAIISWANTYTGDSTLDLTIERLSIVGFNVTANQTVNWDWSNAVQLSGDGESQATAIRGFPDTGLVSVSVQGSNSNGSTQELQWSCTVEDTTPPDSITNLTSVSTEDTVNWTWINPSDDGDFSHVMVYIDGDWVENTSEDYYLLTNLTPQTAYNISTHTVDNYGNINYTWVNHTAKTETVITPTPKPSGGGGRGGGGGVILFAPTPEPTPSPTETPESGVQAGVGLTRPPAPTPMPEGETPTVKETTTETPAPSIKDQKTLPWWQQPTGYIGLIALILGVIVVIVYMAKRQA